MGDAVRGGVVPTELDETIDGDQRLDATPNTTTPLAPDYGELQAVERHHYVITKELARGGMGRVLEARDLRLGREVAIKELLPKHRDAARRFEREARITARLQHPSIIHVYEAGVWPGGEPFYAMPRIAGRSLDKAVAEKRTLEERLSLVPHVIAAADALAYAHDKSIIHRDLKPANVLVGDFGETVVIDWGLAKDLGACADPQESLTLQARASAEETASGSVVGTPAYMSPEQARGEVIDQRADVYSLGALLYKVLGGAAPYASGTSKEVLELVKAGPPTPLHEREPGAPPDLAAIVAKAMAREADDRYATASELAQDLKRFETGQLVGAHRYTLAQRFTRFLRRHRVAVTIATVAAASLVVVAIVSVRSIVRAKDRAETERNKADAGRATLLEERGRAELLDGHAGEALAFLAADERPLRGARGFLIADAMRPFEAELAYQQVGIGDVVVAVSRDGHQIASAGHGAIRWWRQDGARPSLGTHGVTRVVVFDPSSTQLAAAGDDGIARVWANDGKLVAELRGHDGAILDADFSPDGKTLATAGGDGTVRLWDLASGRAIESRCHHARVSSVRFSHDGAYVASASEDKTACVIDRSGKPETTVQLRGHTASVSSAAWSPDDRFIVTASDDGSARVWSPRTGRALVKPLAHDPGSVVRVALPSHDGRLIVSAGSDRIARVWELPELPADDSSAITAVTAKLADKLVARAEIVTAAFCEDDTQVVTGSFDGLAQVWDRETRQPIATFEHGDVVGSLALVPGDAALVTGSRDGAARVWETKVAKVHHDLGSQIHALAVARDGTVAAGTDDSRITLLHGASKDVLHDHLGSVYALAFTPDGKQLLSAGNDTAVFVWNVATGEHVRSFASHDQPVRALAIEPDGDRVAILVDGSVELWSLARGTRLAVLGSHVDALAIDPRTGAIAGASRDGSLRLWDAGGRVLRTTPANPSTPYLAIAFSGGAIVAAGSRFAKVGAVALDGPIEVVRAIAVTPDGSRVITAGDDGVATIWDRDKGKLLGHRDRHARPISALAVDGETLWVASDDGTLAAWDIRVETRPIADIRRFMVEKHVPYEIQDDVVRRQR